MITTTTALRHHRHHQPLRPADQLSPAAPAPGHRSGTTSYSYDGNGNQTGSGGPAGAITNSYNELNQLTHISGPGTNLTLVLRRAGGPAAELRAGHARSGRCTTRRRTWRRAERAGQRRRRTTPT